MVSVAQLQLTVYHTASLQVCNETERSLSSGMLALAKTGTGLFADSELLLFAPRQAMHRYYCANA